jgi:hypothetical protein
MIDTDQSVVKDLARIRGWLLVYVIGPAGFGFLAALDEVTGLWRYGGDVLEWLLGIVFLIVYLVGLYLLIAVRKRFTRVYHMGLTGLMATALAVVAISTGDPVAALSCAGMSAWMGYWTKSKRVQQTYCDNAAQDK